MSMTPERKKALTLIGTTLVVGILIGALSMNLIGRRRQPAGWRKDGKDAFIQKIVGVAEADSAQARQMRPLILSTIAKIDSLQESSDNAVHAVVDSLEVNLRPILEERQLNLLREFHRRGRAKRDQQN
jgi:hypothetical protein